MSSKKGWLNWGDHPFVVSIGVLAASIGAVAAILSIISYVSSPNQSFDYQVRVQSKLNGATISNAEVRIEVSNIAPLRGTTDVRGLSRIQVPASHAGRPARLIVDALDYARFELNIDLEKDRLPVIIQLVPKE